MKVLSLRAFGHDVGDVVQLASRLDYTTTERLLELVGHYYPDEQVPPEKVMRIRDMVRQINAPDESERSRGPHH